MTPSARTRVERGAERRIYNDDCYGTGGVNRRAMKPDRRAADQRQGPAERRVRSGLFVHRAGLDDNPAFRTRNLMRPPRRRVSSSAPRDIQMSTVEGPNVENTLRENEYRPWEAEGITELEYFKRAYLAERRRASVPQGAGEAGVGVAACWPTIHRHADGGYVWTDCAECGPDVAVGEDGDCRTCGEDALYYGREPEAAPTAKDPVAPSETEGGSEAPVPSGEREAREERDKLREAFEELFPVEEGFTEAFDTLERLGMLVEVPADEVFKEEWGDDADTMYVWAWSALASRPGTESEAP